MTDEDREAIKLAAKAIDVAKQTHTPRSKVNFTPQYKEQWSHSLAVGGKQKEHFENRLKAEGLGYTEVNHFGQPRILSDRHRRKIARMMGNVNMDSYYD